MPHVRLATDADAPEVARLLAQLGMIRDPAPIRARWDAWRTAGNLALVAARSDGTLAGVAVLHRMMPLHRPETIGRINALVVDGPDRGHGVGRALVAAAEHHLAETGCSLMEITSNNRLVEAHAFYLHLGYEQTSQRFAKKLTT